MRGEDLPIPKNGHMVRMLRDFLKKRVLPIPVAPAPGILGPDTDSATAQRLRAALIRRPRNPDFGPVPGASPDLQVNQMSLSGAGCHCELGPPLSRFVDVSHVLFAMSISCTVHGASGVSYPNPQQGVHLKLCVLAIQAELKAQMLLLRQRAELDGSGFTGRCLP